MEIKYKQYLLDGIISGIICNILVDICYFPFFTKIPFAEIFINILAILCIIIQVFYLNKKKYEKSMLVVFLWYIILFIIGFNLGSLVSLILPRIPFIVFERDQLNLLDSFVIFFNKIKYLKTHCFFHTTLYLISKLMDASKKK